MKLNWANYDLLSMAFWISKCPLDEICRQAILLLCLLDISPAPTLCLACPPPPRSFSCAVPDSLEIAFTPSYFMEDTAFYFAWGQFYNRWLLPPAVLGLGVFAYNTVFAHLESHLLFHACAWIQSYVRGFRLGCSLRSGTPLNSPWNLASSALSWSLTLPIKEQQR